MDQFAKGENTKGGKQNYAKYIKIIIQLPTIYNSLATAPKETVTMHRFKVHISCHSDS